MIGRDTYTKEPASAASDLQRSANPFGYVDKFYGFGQSLIIKSKIYNLAKDQVNQLAVLNEFRKSFYQLELQKVYGKDLMTQALVEGQKLPHKDLITDMRVAATLRMSLALQEAQEEGKIDSSFTTEEPPLALILNVDLYSTIRVYQVFNDLTELVFQFNLSELIAKEEEAEPV